MWHLKNLKKIAHFYWGGRQLSFAQYKTILTFKELNPDWEIHFYFPEFPQKDTMSWESYEQKYTFIGDDYFNNLMEQAIHIHKIDFMKQFEISNEVSEVHKSDFLRWYLLGTVGGLWSDMDIFYFKPMDYLAINTKENANVDTVVSISDYGHSIGFVLGSVNSKYYNILWQEAKKFYNLNNYQSIGSVMLNQLFPKLETIKEKIPESEPINLPMSAVYAYDANHVKNIFRINDTSKIDYNTIGVHWYAGHPLAGAFLSITAGGVYNFPPCLISRLLQNELYLNAEDVISAHVISGDKILDLGCGDGYIAHKLRTKAEVTTLDVWEKFNPNVLHDLNDLPLPFEDNSFDVILLLDVIEHLEFDAGEDLLKELKRITRRSILILTPLWWTSNHENVCNPESPYFKNPYNTHKCLWTSEDFVDWKRLKGLKEFDKYFFGEWRK